MSKIKKKNENKKRQFSIPTQKGKKKKQKPNQNREQTKKPKSDYFYKILSKFLKINENGEKFINSDGNTYRQLDESVLFFSYILWVIWYFIFHQHQ